MQIREFYIMMNITYGDPGLRSHIHQGTMSSTFLGRGLSILIHVVFNGRAGCVEGNNCSGAPPVNINVNLGDNVIIYFGNMGPSLL